MSLFTSAKENSVRFLKYYFTLKMLGCLLYLFIACNNALVLSPISQKMLSYFSIFDVLKSFSYFSTICQNFATFFNKCCFVVVRLIFLLNSGGTVFQNNSLSAILLSVKFLKYCHFF